MHIVLLNGLDPRSATFIFTYTLEWRSMNIIHPSFRAKKLDWTTAGFLRIEPESTGPLPEGAGPPPKELWIPIDLVQAIFQGSENQQVQLPDKTKVH